MVSGLSDDTTYDAIELYFESQRNSGGPVERVRFEPKSGQAVVVFQDRRGKKLSSKSFNCLAKSKKELKSFKFSKVMRTHEYFYFQCIAEVAE